VFTIETFLGVVGVEAIGAHVNGDDNDVLSLKDGLPGGEVPHAGVPTLVGGVLTKGDLACVQVGHEKACREICHGIAADFGGFKIIRVSLRSVSSTGASAHKVPRAE
jgi:hypothetical protein